ncbi:hypothetical protein CEXT_223791 [Caerostris extrusa]|uniref:Uncharacterized protein n=1 Tax=Caerostris extrusa TaxID=172846 RepID=A0AAV4XTM9_CAEEX|nr:hypothetical protein CEXT_223791 [Caerostris extrusa]
MLFDSLIAYCRLRYRPFDDLFVVITTKVGIGELSRIHKTTSSYTFPAEPLRIQGSLKDETIDLSPIKPMTYPKSDSCQANHQSIGKVRPTTYLERSRWCRNFRP